MIETVIEKVVEHSVVAAALLVLVIAFLRHLRSTAEDASKRDKLFTETIKQVSTDARESARQCHEVHRESIAALQRNSEALQRVNDKLQV